MAEKTGVLKRLQKKIKNKKEELSHEEILQQQVDDLRRILEARDEMYRQSDNENMSLHRQLQAVKELSLRLQKDKSELEAAYAEQQAELEQLQADKVSVDQKVAELESALSSATQQLEQQQQELQLKNQLQEEVHKLQAEVAEAVAERNRLEHYSSKVQGYVDDYRARLHAQSNRQNSIGAIGLKAGVPPLARQTSVTDSARILASIESAKEHRGLEEAFAVVEAKDDDGKLLLEVDATSIPALKVKDALVQDSLLNDSTDLLSDLGIGRPASGKWLSRPMSSMFQRWQPRTEAQQH